MRCQREKLIHGSFTLHNADLGSSPINTALLLARQPGLDRPDRTLAAVAAAFVRDPRCRDWGSVPVLGGRLGGGRSGGAGP